MYLFDAKSRPIYTYKYIYIYIYKCLKKWPGWGVTGVKRNGLARYSYDSCSGTDDYIVSKKKQKQKPNPCVRKVVGDIHIKDGGGAGRDGMDKRLQGIGHTNTKHAP